MLFNIFLSLIIFIGLNSYSINIFAEDDEKASSSEEITDDASPKKPKGIPGKKKEYKTIDEFLEDGEYISIDGFMNVLHETEKDKYYLILNEDQLNKEFIYFTYILNGPSDAGPSGGDMGEAFILEFRKFKEDIGIYKKNTKFIYDDSNKISQSKLTNIIEAFLGRFSVVVNEDSKYLINIDKMFLSEMLVAITPNIPKEYMEYYNLILGRPDKSKTFIDEVKNYEKNTSFKVRYGFFNPKPKSGGSIDAITDKRYTYVDGLHLFVAVSYTHLTLPTTVIV